jgi:hypothetical protein
MYDVPLRDIKVSVWYAMVADRIVGSTFFSETISSHRNVTHILTPCFEHVDKMGRWLEGNIGNYVGGEV